MIKKKFFREKLAFFRGKLIYSKSILCFVSVLHQPHLWTEPSLGLLGYYCDLSWVDSLVQVSLTKMEWEQSHPPLSGWYSMLIQRLCDPDDCFVQCDPHSYQDVTIPLSKGTSISNHLLLLLRYAMCGRQWWCLGAQSCWHKSNFLVPDAHQTFWVNLLQFIF